MHQCLRRIIRRVDAADRGFVRRSAAFPRSIADPGLKSLSTAANHSLLWLSAAACLSLRKGPARRGALRGAVAIAAASATTNLIGKPLFPRRRPAMHLIPAHRGFRDPPRSSSFPSGHAASAAAFTTAVAMESPALGLVIAPVAAAVVYSRVHTGVHWPTDVLFGSVLGAGLASITRHWWPLRPDVRAEVRQPADAPALHHGAGLFVLVNPDSGDGTLDPGVWMRTHWPEAQVLHPQDGELTSVLETALERADGVVRAIGVAGGDGTVAAVADVAARRNLPLAVLPAGTLNHFARDAGVEAPAETAAAVERGDAADLDLAGVSVDGRQARRFVNTASLGGYPDMVRLREKWAPRWGKWPAAAAALVRVLHTSTPLEVELNGFRCRVWVLFVGNGSYAPRGFAPTWRPRLDNGRLDVRYVRADLPLSRARFVLAALTGTLHRSHAYVEREHRFLDVRVAGPPVAVATDGEVGLHGNRFTFTAQADVLTVYRPLRS